MKTNGQIEREIDRTMAALDGLEAAAPPPFLLTRTEARLRTRLGRTGVPEPVINWAFRPVWLVASLGLALLLNLSVVAYAHDQFQQRDQDEETVGLVDEWGVFSNTTDW